MKEQVTQQRDQVTQQRKIFGLIAALTQAVNALLLFYSPNTLCLTAMKNKIDRISKSLDAFIEPGEEPPYPDR